MLGLSRSIRVARLVRALSSAPQFSPLAAKAAEEVSSKWKGTTANGGKTKNYIAGEFRDSRADNWLEVRDPVSVWIFCTSSRLFY
jgi:hypothetical protein